MLDKNHVSPSSDGDKAKKAVTGSIEKTEQELSDLRHELQQVQDQLVEAHEREQQVGQREQRALADYQNLLRRTDTDRVKLVKFATRALVEDVLQPLEHLSLAAEHVQDAGLSMALKQLWQKLNDHGLEEMEVIGKEFNLNTMEAVEIQGKDAKKVVQVVRRGYLLNGEVIQHAKVVLGDE